MLLLKHEARALWCSDTLITRLSAALGGSVECVSAQHLPTLSVDPIVIQLRENGRLLLSQTAQIDPVLLAQESVVYTFENRVERFYAKDEVRVVTNPAQGYPSVFAVPTFDSLKRP